MVAIFYGFFAYFGLTALFAFLTFHFLLVGFVAGLFMYFLLRKRFGQGQRKWLVIGYFFWIGYFFFSFSGEENIIREGPVETVVRVQTFPVIDGNQLETVVSSQDGDRVLLFYYLQSEEEKGKWEKRLKPGAFCRVTGERKQPGEPSNPNGFHYGIYLQTQRIVYILSADQLDSCREGKKTLFDHIRFVREYGVQLIEKSFPESVAPFVTALLFGEKEELDQDIFKAYQQLGIAHLLAISGLHVSVLSAAIYYGCLRIGLTKETARNGLLLFLPVYAGLAGGAPSVNRAVFMAWIVVFLSKWRHNLHPLDALGLSFLLFILVNPYILYHVGFQLSYAVSACLLLSGPLVRRQRHWLRTSALVSFVAQLGSVPILLFHFYEFSLFGLVLNILYVPFYSTVLLPLCLVAFLLLLFAQWVVRPLIFLVSLLLDGANSFAEWASKFELFTWTLGKPPIGMLLLFYASFIIGLILMEKGENRHRWKVVLWFVLPFCLQTVYVKVHPFGEITFLNVGQGDSIWIRLPFHQGNYLIDTGGIVRFPDEDWKRRKDPFDPGEDIVVPFLKSKGVTKIDKVILTHGDADHIGSAEAVLSEFRVGELFVGWTTNKKEMERQIITFAKERNIPVTEVFRGVQWKRGKGRFSILSPIAGSPSDNDSSVVLYARLGGLSWLFTGDLEREGELEMIKAYPNLKVDVLKVGHHGSETSTTPPFLQQIRPKVAIISAGKNNRYGHPHERVVEDLQRAGVFIFRTDTHGAVTYRYFLAKGHFQTMLPE